MSSHRVRRPYDNTKRQLAAEERQQRILDVATLRFVELGWTRATIADIAAGAEVSEELVLKRFGSKVRLLLTAFRRAGFGPNPDLEAAVATLGLEDLGSVEERIEALVGFGTAALAGLAPLVPALKHAADADQEAAEVVRGLQQGRLATSRRMAALLLGVDEETVDTHEGLAETIYALTTGECYLAFTVELGRPASAYAVWLRNGLQDLVRRYGTDQPLDESAAEAL